jgi:TolB-like protein
MAESPHQKSEKHRVRCEYRNKEKSMKRNLLIPLLCLSAALCFAQTGGQATGTFDMALVSARSYTENQLPPKTKVLIAGFAAPTKEAGSYAADALSALLVNGGRLTVVERSPEVLQALSAESGYQLSGEVGDDSIQSIGQKTGAEVILTGTLLGSGDQYRLSLKLTGVKSGEIAGQWNTAIQTDTVLNALLTGAKPPAEKPRWIAEPLSVRAKYESGGAAASEWYYDIGISNKTASEQLARTRARQNIQQVTAENIASEMKARIDITSLSLFQSSSVEDAEFRVEAALTNSIKTRVPRYETLEWHVETGNTGGKDWYIAYMLVRFPRKDIIAMVEKLEPERIADTLIRQFPAAAPASKDEFVRELIEVRDYALEGIRESLTEH